MSEEEAIKEIEDYLDYEGSVSIQAIATLYTSYNKEKEKNRQSKMRIVQLENEITARIEDVNKYFISKDKIKAKIEELENEKEKYFEKQVIQHEIEILQSLLDKE